MVSTGVPRPGSAEPDEPAAFRAAVNSMARASFRAEVAVDPMPAPQRIAPYSSAIAAEVTVADDDEIATGRLILLHDPAGNPAWDGTFRLVAYARATIDPEQVSDQLLPEVGWSYLTNALDDQGAECVEVSGTVTRVASDGFGSMSDENSAQLEIRASWTPISSATLPDGVAYPDVSTHAQAWVQAMCEAAGMEPVPEGVTVLSERRPLRAGLRTL